jgi:hypothetical protein
MKIYSYFKQNYMHSAGLPPASGLGWVLCGGTPRRGKLAGFILTIDCTLLASSGTWPPGPG